MLVTTAFGAFSIIVVLYLGMDSWVYRRPWVLLIAGLIASLFSFLLKGTPLILKMLPKPPWSAQELELAASIVDPTLIGLAGGLIASAFIIKIQILHARDLERAKESLKRALEGIEKIDRADDDLRLVAKSLSNEEFRTRLKQIQTARRFAIADRLEAEDYLRDLDIPGLK